MKQINPMSPLQKVKEKIVSLIPEIMALEFGCEVEVQGIRQDNPGCEYDVVVDQRIKDGKITLGYFGAVPLDSIKILGRPIALSDVLLAIRKFGNEIIVIREDGDFLRYDTDSGTYISFGMYWEFLSDSLDDQSPETIQFLFDILGCQE